MASFDRNNVDRLFRENLDNAEMPVSNKAWGAIASEMEKDQLRRKVFWARSTAAAAVLLLIAMGSWTLLSLRNTNDGYSVDFASAKIIQKMDNSHGIGYLNCDLPSPNQKDRLPTLAPFRYLTKGLPKQIRKSNSKLFPIKQLKERIFSDLALQPTTFETAIASTMPDILALRETSHFASLEATPQRNPANAVKYFETVSRIVPKKEKEFTFVLDETNKNERKDKRWELGGALSPDMLFASTTPVQQATSRTANTLADDATNADTKRLSPVTAFSTGIKAGFEINDRISLRTGLMYSNRHTTASEDVVSYGKTDFLQNNLNLHYIEVPMTMKYNVIHNSNFDYFVAGGVSANLFLYYDNSLSTSDGQVAARRVSEKSDVLTPSQANVLVSTGMQYRLFNRLSMQLEPGLRYGIKTNALAFSQSRPMSMSLLSGISYHF